MGFFESLRLAIALGLTIFMVLLRFDAERIMRSDYFKYRTAWFAPLSYYLLVLLFAVGIAFILPSGRVTATCRRPVWKATPCASRTAVSMRCNVKPC